MGWGRETTLLGGVKATAFEGRGYVSAVAGRMALLVYLLDLYRREHCWGEVRTGWLCSQVSSVPLVFKMWMGGWMVGGWMDG